MTRPSKVVVGATYGDDQGNRRTVAAVEDGLIAHPGAGPTVVYSITRSNGHVGSPLAGLRRCSMRSFLRWARRRTDVVEQAAKIALEVPS